MLTDTFHSITSAARNVFRNWQSLLLVAAVYALLLGALYSFVAVREASLAQVVLTFALAIAAPLLFFLLQALITNAVSAGPGGATEESSGSTAPLTAVALLKRSLASFWKLLLITLPLIALALLLAYLLGKAQAYFSANLNPATELARPRAAGSQAAARPIVWRAALLSTIRYLAFGLALPLAAIHLWLATTREGLGRAVRKVGTHLARAFSPQSVLTYIAGFLVFGVVPYFLLFRSTPTKQAWLDIFLLVARLAVIFALTLIGWMITVRALSLFPARATNDQGEAI
jgi:hypothetical protein